jgi:hypothetical protein
MPQFAVFMYEKPVAFEDIPPEVMAAHEQTQPNIEKAGGKLTHGFAAAPGTEARTVLGDGTVRKGPWHEDSVQDVAGFFIVEANDIEHAVELAKCSPILDGGKEVRPLLGSKED